MTPSKKRYNFRSTCSWKCASCQNQHKPWAEQFAWRQLMREWEIAVWLPAEEWREDFSNSVCWLWLVAIIPGGQLALGARFADVVQQTLFALNISIEKKTEITSSKCKSLYVIQRKCKICCSCERFLVIFFLKTVKRLDGNTPNYFASWNVQKKKPIKDWVISKPKLLVKLQV